MEYDLDSYKRKFFQTKVVYQINGKGNLNQGWVEDIGSDGNDNYHAKIGGLVWCIKGQTANADIIYYPIKSGIFGHSQKENIFFILQRKHQKTYQVGLGNAYFYMSFDLEGNEAGEHLRYVDLLCPVKNKPYDGRKSGWLNSDFWYREDKLYYRHQAIGFIKNEKSLLVSNPSLIKPLQRAWDKECQILALSNILG